MTKYNPNLIRHRRGLATGVLNLCSKWGFVIDDNATQDTWEFVLTKKDKYFPGMTHIIFTGINKTDGLMRTYAADRIRFVVRFEGDGHGFHRRVARVNRTGEFSAILNRVVDAMKKSQKERV